MAVGQGGGRPSGRAGRLPIAEPSLLPHHLVEIGLPIEAAQRLLQVRIVRRRRCWGLHVERQTAPRAVGAFLTRPADRRCGGGLRLSTLRLLLAGVEP
ncbi:hypothetical protein [Mycobacterium sp.]|uniref:hypothetical protein n=1 Tax=Mycobacterium sp. TaxID=1785 RepID=UPI0033423B71